MNAGYRRGIAAPGMIPAGAVEAFRERSARVGDHRVWRGTTAGRTPVLVHHGVRYPALQVAWVLHHGSAPVGQIRTICGVQLCVAGRCLTDEETRQREHLLMAAIRGIDMSGTCAAGHGREKHATLRADGSVECRVCDSERRKARWRARREAKSQTMTEEAAA